MKIERIERELIGEEEYLCPQSLFFELKSNINNEKLSDDDYRKNVKSVHP